ncbi:MAG: paraquat-inducible protein A [Candidatus Thiodiazotropha lotti]|nr:paraquat-inducible protein A [Candidatus Thiodiazotropha lotti]
MQVETESQAVEIPLAAARRLMLLLLVSSGLLIAGLWLPMLTLTKFLLIANSFSVISGVVELYKRDQWFLFVAVGLFSVLLPLFKLVFLFLLLRSRQIGSAHFQRWLKWMHDFGRWAMLDVMVVAVMIVTVKLGVVAEVEIHSGLYLFGAAVLLIMYITHQVVVHFERGQQ